MFIYRIEHSTTKKGPYNTDDLSEDDSDFIYDMGMAHTGNPHTPGPWKDKLADYLGNGNFACPTLKKLKAWFDGYTEKLFSMGYHIIKIKIDPNHVVIGKSKLQCMFNQEKVIWQKVYVATEK
jgi:hypothetical protein